MWRIIIKFSFMDEELEYYFDSLNQASKELDISLYFLRQCSYKRNRNQFCKFFKVDQTSSYQEEEESDDES